ncbi:hypothetical protein GCM10023153_08370 [Ornithinibacter aureus]|uniref:Uncharacterized protein n=1 Tax=Ornithinibacter aureus TaxID=622664 RepID=A0ABP8JHE4_9MICO
MASSQSAPSQLLEVFRAGTCAPTEPPRTADVPTPRLVPPGCVTDPTRATGVCH